MFVKSILRTASLGSLIFFMALAPFQAYATEYPIGANGFSNRNILAKASDSRFMVAASDDANMKSKTLKNANDKSIIIVGGDQSKTGAMSPKLKQKLKRKIGEDVQLNPQPLPPKQKVLQ